MKKMMTVAMALIVACSCAFAQTAEERKQLIKERQEVQKLAKKDLKAKVDKNTRKEAKRLKKEGWQVKPGALPLEKQLERIVTIAYLALLRIDRRMEKLQGGYEAQWVPVGSLPRLAFDHEEIVRTAVLEVERLARLTPTILFDLLPRKFTAAQLRLVMEHVAGLKCDVKNFHKKLAQMPYVVPLDEKEEGVSHRAARYYKFKNIKTQR